MHITESDMDQCLCGRELRSEAERLACIDCGAGCCPACAIHLESTAYCRTCAGSLLGTPFVRASSPLVVV